MLGKVMDISYTKPAHLEIVNTLLTRVYMGSYILWLFVKGTTSMARGECVRCL